MDTGYLAYDDQKIGVLSYIYAATHKTNSRVCADI